MTSSQKKNNTKQTSRIISSSSHTNLIKSNSKNKTLSYSSKKLLKFELTKTRLNPLILDKLIIEWNEKEKEIYIAGCFYKNNKLYLSTNDKMYKYFRFNSNLINSLNGIKFKTKGKMKISSIYIINNKNSKAIKNKEKSPNIFSNNNSTKESSLISIPKHQIKNDIIIDFAFSNKNYCNYIPKQNEMRTTADKKPCHFPIECFHGINQIHNEIGNKEYLTLTDSSVFNSNNDSYKNIDRKEHFLLNHLCQKNVNNKLINSFTVKYRHKNATFVYYK